MESKVPENILDDPEGPSEFFVQKLSMMSSDFEVFADPEHKQKWLALDQQGSMWFDKDVKVNVENYVRPPDGKLGTGQCLASCKLDTIGREDYKFYDLTGTVTSTGRQTPILRMATRIPTTTTTSAKSSKRGSASSAVRHGQSSTPIGPRHSTSPSAR